jgi:hypothetical protein
VWNKKIIYKDKIKDVRVARRLIEKLIFIKCRMMISGSLKIAIIKPVEKRNGKSANEKMLE